MLHCTPPPIHCTTNALHVIIKKQSVRGFHVSMIVLPSAACHVFNRLICELLTSEWIYSSVVNHLKSQLQCACTRVWRSCEEGRAAGHGMWVNLSCPKVGRTSSSSAWRLPAIVWHTGAVWFLTAASHAGCGAATGVFSRPDHEARFLLSERKNVLRLTQIR